MSEVIEAPGGVGLPEFMSVAEVGAHVLRTAELLEDKMPLIPFHIGAHDKPRRVLRRALPLKVEESLEASGSGEPVRITPQLIVNEVGNIFGVKPNDIRGNSRARAVLLAQQVAIYMASEHTELDAEQLSKIFIREPKAITSAIKKVAQKIEEDEDLAANIQKVKDEITSPNPRSMQRPRNRVIIVTKAGLFECIVHKLTPEELKSAQSRFKEVLYVGSAQEPDPKLMEKYGRLAWQQLLGL